MRASKRRSQSSRVLRERPKKDDQEQLSQLYIKPIVNPAQHNATNPQECGVGRKRDREDSGQEEEEEEDKLELVLEDDEDVRQETGEDSGGNSLLQQGYTIVAQNNIASEVEEQPILVYENVVGSQIIQTSVVKKEYMSAKVQPCDDYTVEQLVGLKFNEGQMINGFMPIMCATPAFKLKKNGPVYGSVMVLGWLHVHTDKVYFIGLRGDLMSTSRNQFAALGGKAACNSSKRTIYSNFETGKNYRLEVCEKIFNFSLSLKKNNPSKGVNSSPSLENSPVAYDEFHNANVITTYQHTGTCFQHAGITGENNPTAKSADQSAAEALDAIKNMKNVSGVRNGEALQSDRNARETKSPDQKATIVLEVTKDVQNVEDENIQLNAGESKSSADQVQVQTNGSKDVQNANENKTQGQIFGLTTEAGGKVVGNPTHQLENQMNNIQQQKLVQQQQQDLLQYQRTQLLQQQKQLQQQFQIYSSLFSQQIQNAGVSLPPVLNISNAAPQAPPQNLRVNLKNSKQQQKQIKIVRKNYQNAQQQNKQQKILPRDVIPQQLFVLPQSSCSQNLVTTGQLPQHLPNVCMHLPQGVPIINEKPRGDVQQEQDVIIIGDDSDNDDEIMCENDNITSENQSKNRIVSINYMYSQIQQSDQATKSTDSNVDCELSLEQKTEIQNILNQEKQSNKDQADQNNKIARKLHEKFAEVVKPVIWCDLHGEYRWFQNEDDCFFCPQCVFQSMSSQKKAQNQDFENKSTMRQINDSKLKVYNNEQLVIYYLQWVEEAKKQLKIFEDQIRQLQLFVNSYQNGISELNSLKEAVQKEINVNVSSQKTNFLKYSKGMKKIEQLEKEAIQLQKESTKSFQF